MSVKPSRTFASPRMKSSPKTTVWAEFTPLAMKHKAVNLGQGFPSWHPPEIVRRHAVEAVTDAMKPLNNQYARPMGHVELVTPLAEAYTKKFGRTVDPLSNILITNGSTQALYCAFQTMLGNGEEVVMFEPYFDLYAPDVEMAGGKPVLIPLRPNAGGRTSQDWVYDKQELERAMRPQTKIIIVNTPQNVPGKVWTQEELEHIASLAKKHDVYVIMDEVYEYMVYDGLTHIHMATLPGMWERTLTLCSAGKTLSATGWKIGWTVAPAEMITVLLQTHSHQAFSVATPLQIAVGRSLTTYKDGQYYLNLRKEYQAKRDLLCKVLQAAGLNPITPKGSYFVVADISAVPESLYVNPTEKSVAKDWQFARWLTTEFKVTGIPVSAFYSQSKWAIAERYVRFAFCRELSELEEAGRRLLPLAAVIRKDRNAKL